MEALIPELVEYLGAFVKWFILRVLYFFRRDSRSTPTIKELVKAGKMKNVSPKWLVNSSNVWVGFLVIALFIVMGLTMG
tara:strand:- start:4556 stop:4792 length:237 start_codon:yes stop_codon:yes gene_type:complete